MRPVALLLAVALALPGLARAQRPDEGDLFGSESAGPADGGATVDAPPDAGTLSRDEAALGGGESKTRFETNEAVNNPLTLGANLNMFFQVLGQEGKELEAQQLSQPNLLELYLDGRPNEDLRVFGLARLQFDASRPVSTGAPASTNTVAGTTGLGFTPTTGSNPNVLLDQLWLRFNVAKRVFFTVGRQKVRWGVSRIWFPTDFLNAQPRDPFNPFDVRLGVDMVKVHVPVESLGWNFYAYGLLNTLQPGDLNLTLGRLGGALRGEFVLGPVEVGIGGVWQYGRRPRYAVDVSAGLGPFDVYAEAAFRDARDFVITRLPGTVTPEELGARLEELPGLLRTQDLPTAVNTQLAALGGSIGRGSGLLVQVSGGASVQFNYADKYLAVLTAEYFYNPAGYATPLENLSSLLLTQGLFGYTLDPVQSIPLYGGRHYLAIAASFPGLPGGLTWMTLNVSNTLNLNDVSGTARLDVVMRVLQYLTVQVFVSGFYGNTGGDLRFSVPDAVRTPLSAVGFNLPQIFPLSFLGGALLRVSI